MKAPIILVLVAPLALSACVDDANDASVRGRAVPAVETTQVRSAPAASTPIDVDTPAGGAPDAATSPVAPTTAPSVEPTGVVVRVLALDNTFRPEVIAIAVGDEVAWENRGQNEHNILRVEGDGWGVTVDHFQPGDVYSHVFTRPGTFGYFCSIHGNETVGMIGTVVVNS